MPLLLASIVPRQFVLFGPDHVGALAAVATVALVLIAVVRRAASLCKRRLAGGLATLLTVAVLLETPIELATGTWRIVESLPFHLCDLALLMSIVALYSAARDPRPPWEVGGASNHPASARNHAQLAYELCWYWGLAGTLQALLTPSVFQAFPHPHYLIYFLLHGGIIVTAMLLTIGFGWRPRPRSAWRALLITYALGPPIGFVDWLIGANYMYLCGPPPSASIYDYFGPWPWSLATLAAIGVVLMWACYAPFAVINATRRPRPNPQRQAGC